MSGVKQLMGDYVWELCEVESVNERFQLLKRSIMTLGFDAVIYTFVPTVRLGHQSLRPAMSYSESFSKSFLTDYMVEQWQRSDFTVRYIKQRHKGVMDWHEYESSPCLSADERALIAKARHDYGINNALSIPLSCNGRGGAGASVVSLEHGAAFLRLKHERLQALVNFIEVFHKFSIDQVERLPFTDLLVLFYRLKPKEVAVLRHLATAQPLKSIMDIYPDIKTDKAAYKVLDNVRNKLFEVLGTRVTKDYLIHLVGLFDILVLYPE